MDADIDRITRAAPRAEQSRAHGARLVVAPDDFARTSPFLLMAEDWFAPPAGFPDHPHRGMQTVTFVLEGGLEHRDHTGAHGVLGPGDVQWMTAGRGVIHSEMPAPGGAHTLQLWLNLPAQDKMSPAAYRDQPVKEVPVHRDPGVELRVYAGRSHGLERAHHSLWPLTLLEARVKPGKRVTLEVPPGHRAFLYALEGAGRIEGGDEPFEESQVVWFKPAAPGPEPTVVGLEADARLRALLFASPPIEEEVFAYGPFVMNTVEEIRQAYADYQAGTLAP